MTENESPPQEAPYKSIGERLKPVLGIVAPTTLVTALLIYFGYRATQSRFLHFGVSLDLVNPASTDLLFYGSEALFVGVVGLAVIALIPIGLYLAGRWLVSEPRRDGLTGWISLALCWAGTLLLVRALLGFVVPGALLLGRIEVPLALTLGALMLRYALWLWQARAAHRPTVSRILSTEAFDLCRGILLVLLLAGLFWTGNEAALLYGEMRGATTARDLASRPEVVLFLQDPLYTGDLPEGVTASDTGEQHKFRYRYDRLRLLVESDGRLFLSPADWRPGTNRGVLVIPNTSDVRLLLLPPR